MTITKANCIFGAPKVQSLRPLFIDMIPSTCWFSNLSSELTPNEWTLIKKKASARAGYCCEICAGRGPKWPVECHERWAFNTSTRVQTLLGVSALCPDCHEVTHFGFARVQDRDAVAKQHLMKINSWTATQANQHIDDADELWLKRSSVEDWKLDARWILGFVTLTAESKTKILGYANQMLERK